MSTVPATHLHRLRDGEHATIDGIVEWLPIATP